MTTTQQSQSTHLRHLVSALGPMTTNAILGLVDEEVKRLTEVSNEIVAQQRGVIKDAAATNDVKAVKAANQATPVVKEAAKAVEQAAESGNPDDAAKAKAKVTEAKEAVSEAEVAVQEAVKRHEAILAVNHEGPRPPSRLDKIEDSITGLRGAVDQSASASAHALAVAQAGGGRRTPIWKVVVTCFVVALPVIVLIEWFMYDHLIAWAMALVSLFFALIVMAILAIIDIWEDDEGIYTDARAQVVGGTHADAQASAKVRQSA